MNFYRLGAILALLLIGTVVHAGPVAEAKRFVRGVPSTPACQSFVIPADQQKGVSLQWAGNNAALYDNVPEEQLPWFSRVQRAGRYHISAVQNGVPVYTLAENPVVAFGESSGGTPLYTSRDYRFGVFAGLRDTAGSAAPLSGKFRIKAYRRADFANGQLDVAPVEELVVELEAPSKTVTFRGLETVIGVIGVQESAGGEEQWGVPNDPFVIRHRANSTEYCYVVEYQGWATAGGTAVPMVTTNVSSPSEGVTFSPLYTLEFSTLPPWRSTLIHAPHFRGEPVPSWYYGKSLQELQAAWGFVPPVPPEQLNGVDPKGAKAVDHSPELRSHPVLDRFVESMGSDPIALTNYVFNEIELADPVSYNEDGSLSNASINCGGLNRGALGAYLEGQGNPWEQCALLVYLLRKADVAAVYCEPEANKLSMLDTQLSNLLRMQIKGAQTPGGTADMPTAVPVNYPCVAAWVEAESRWVYLFPWLKDTEVVEGPNLYDQLTGPIKTGHEWVYKYLEPPLPWEYNAIAAYQEKNGRVVIEAEGFHAQVPHGSHRWESASLTSPSGYSGSSVMQVLPNAGTAGGARLDYEVDFSTPGVYYVWVRGQADTVDDDAVTIGVNGVIDTTGTQGVVSGFGQEYEWRTRAGSSSSVTTINIPQAGRYKVNVWMYKDGFRFDKLILSTTSTQTGSEPPTYPYYSSADGRVVIPGNGFQATANNTADCWWQGNPFGSVMTAFSNVNITTIPVADRPTLSYNVHLPNGTHYIWVYGKANSTSHGVRVQGALVTGFGQSGAWRGGWGIVIQGGRQIVSIALESAGFQVEKILLSSLPPTGSSLNPGSYDPSIDPVPPFSPLSTPTTPPLPDYLSDSVSSQLPVGQNSPSARFVGFVRPQLTGSIAFEDLGMKIRDRRHQRETWDEFPKPFQFKAGAHTFFEKLADRTNTFDTVRVRLWSDRNKDSLYNGSSTDGPLLDTGEWFAADLHNRPLYVKFKQVSGGHSFDINLDSLRNAGIAGGDFLTGDRAGAQTRGGLLTASDDTLQFEITHQRNRRAAILSVYAIDVTNGGSGYTSSPNVIIQGAPNGRTAAATAVVENGKVVKVIIYDPGAGYSEAPAVTFSGGGGTGAQARARIENLERRWIHPLGVDASRVVVQKPIIRKGELAAICLNFGRVTDRMLRVHAEEFWQIEKALKTNPGQVNSERMQPLSAYLMGMSYYERVSRFKETNERLHKARIFSMYAAGLSKLAPARDESGQLVNGGEIIPRMASVDMFFLNAAYAANGTVHPDSGMPFSESIKDFWHLMVAEASAQEHEVINDYYKESAAISTVRLLQRGGFVKLTRSNYESHNAATWYTFNGETKRLDAWEPSIWAAIKKAFEEQGGENAVAFITPGPVRNAGGSYAGIGAMVFGSNSYAALISADMSVSNGGVGSDFITPMFQDNTRLNLELNLTGYSIGFRPLPTPTNTYVAPVMTGAWAFGETMAGLNSNAYALSNFQQVELATSARLLGISSAPAGDLFGISMSRGPIGDTSFFGPVSSEYSTIAGWIGDPVDLVTGNFYIDAVDLTLPGPMPIEIRRNYSSQSLADGDFGPGWKLAYFPYLVVGDNDLIYGAEMDGSVIAYRKDPQDPSLYVPTPEDNPCLKNIHAGGVGATENVLNNRLRKLEEGVATIYRLDGTKGSVRSFKVRSFPVGTITRSRPYLETWKDGHGNTLSFLFNEDPDSPAYGYLKRIAANNGNFVGFEHDVFGHIVEAWTRDGRRVKYGYDNQGDLRTVTLPDGAVHSYRYLQETTSAYAESIQTSKHLLTSETKPDGRFLSNSYDDKRRVKAQSAVVGQTPTPVTNARFEYVNTENPDKTWSGYTWVYDAYGTLTRRTKYTYTKSLIENEDDPETPPEAREWYFPGDTSVGAYPRSLKKITDRRGVVTFFKYDSSGNLIEKSLGTDAQPADIDGDGTAKASGPPEKAVTTWTYTSLNQPESETSPSGVQTWWFYDDSDYPYLATRVEKHVGGQLVSKLARDYYEILPQAEGAPSAFGLLERERVAANSPDEAIVEWKHNQHGFPTRKTQFTGTNDPHVVVELVPNLRGEVVQEKDTLCRTWKHAYDAMGRRVWSERRDAEGNLLSWNYTYYNLNGEVEWTDGPRYDPEDYTWQRYDRHGRRTEEIRWRSQAKADGTGVEAASGDSLTSTTFFRYDLFGNMTEIRNPRRNSVWMEYDQIGRMLRREYYDGYRGEGGTLKANESFTYEPGGEVATHTNVLGGVTSLWYNARGQVRKRTNPDGSEEQWRYYNDGRLWKEILRNGSYWETIYDDLNRTATRRFKAAGGELVKTVVTKFDRRGNKIEETVDGFTSTTTYDDLNRPKVVTGPPATADSAQQTTTYYYNDGAGREEEVVNGLQEKTITIRDALGRVESVEVRDATGAVVRRSSSAYSPDHHSVTSTEGSGTYAMATQTFTDTFGNTVLVRQADGTYARSRYDDGGLLVEARDRAGRVSSYKYNWQGKISQELRPADVVIDYDYDLAGNRVEKRMPGGLAEMAQFDSASRKQWSYLAQGGNSTRRVDYQYYPQGHVWAGLFKNSTSQRGIVTTVSYDAALRPKTLTSEGTDTLTRSLDYNERDMVTEILETGANNPVPVRLQRVIDGYGQVSGETVSIGSESSSVGQTFDAAGRRATLQGAGPTRTFGYRADGKMTGVTVGGQTYSTTFGDSGLLLERSNPYRTVTVQARDVLKRITDLRTNVGGVQALKEAVPLWSNLDKVTAVHSDREGENSFDESRNYLYEQKSGRLSYESYRPSAAHSAEWIENLYDGATEWSAGGSTGGLGIRTRAWRDGDNLRLHEVPSIGNFGRVESEVVRTRSKTVKLTGTAFGAAKVSLTLDGRSITPVSFNGALDSAGRWSASRVLGPGNHLLTASATHPSGWEAPAAISSFDVQPENDTLTNYYDGMGNVVRRKWSSGREQLLKWDPRGRLVKVIEPGRFTWRALYDGLDRRIQTSYTQQGGQTVKKIGSVFDPEVEFLELGIITERGSTWKIYGSDLSGSYGGLQGLGGLEAVVGVDNVTRGIINDWFGNVVGWMESPGDEVTWSEAQFLAWGPVPGWGTDVQDGVTPLHQLLGYRGLTLDPPGFYHLGLRDYDSEVGRWLSPDPLGHAGSLSLYDYCDNDPVNAFDPDGRLATSVLNNPRVQGGLMLAGGGAEAAVGGGLLFAPEPVLTKIGGGIMFAHGSDVAATGWRQLWSGRTESTLTQLAVSTTARALGASPETARNIGAGVDMGLSLGGTIFGSYQLSRAPSQVNLGRISISTSDAAVEGGAGWKPTPFNQCFPAGTMVLMADGSTKPIEQVVEGDEVLADEPDDDSPPSAKRVTHRHRNWTQRFIHVAVDTDLDGSGDCEIRATGEHPFWTANRGWVAAKDLALGDRLRTPSASSPMVVSAGSVPTIADTYNLTVQGAHTFYALAGSTPLLVHNTEPFEIAPYGSFGSPRILSNGAPFQGHELLQNGWLKYNGYRDFRALNPSLATPTTFHQQVIFGEQAAAGLHNPSLLRSMSAYDNIRANIAVLKASGVDRSVIADLANQARNFAKSLPCR